MSYSSTVLGDGASLYLKLDETSGTTVGSAVGGYTGTIQAGGTTLNQPGVDGRTACQFSGGMITVPTGAYQTFGTGGFSMECWMRRTVVPTQVEMLCTAQIPAYPRAVFYYHNGDATHLWFSCADTLGSPIAEAGVLAPSDGQWRHFVGVCRRGSPDVTELWCNGVLAASTPWPRLTGLDFSCTANFDVGVWEGSSAPFHGWLDEVALYKTALTPTQIAAHYAAVPQTGKKMKPPVHNVLVWQDPYRR